MKEKKRIDWIDTSKGFLIFFVVLGHIISDNKSNLQNWIYSFHIPAFFILEGYLLHIKSANINHRPFRIMLKKNFYNLMYPYIIFSTIFLVRVLIQVFIGMTLLYELYIYTILTILTCGVGVLWFLPTYFYAQNLFLYYYLKNKKFIIIVLTIIALGVLELFQKELSYSQEYFDMFLLLRLIIKSILGCSFILVGFYISSIEKKYQKSYTIELLLLILSFFFFGFNGTVDFNILQLNNVFYYYCFAILGSVGIIGLSKIVSKYPNIFNNILMYFGKNSLIVMLTHSIFYIFKAIKYSIIRMGVSNFYLTVLLTFVLTMTVEYLLIEIINQNLSFLIRCRWKKKEKT